MNKRLGHVFQHPDHLSNKICRPGTPDPLTYRDNVMDENNKGEDKRHLPAQQAQQPQPSGGGENDWPPVTNDQDETIDGAAFKPADGPVRRAAENEGGDGPLLDEARFTAGVVKLYEAVLKEPIPDEMLSLINKIGKQERQ